MLDGKGVHRCSWPIATTKDQGSNAGVITRLLMLKPPSGLRPMIDFDPSEPAILHDRLNDRIEPWTGEEADDYRQNSIVHPDGTVEWHGQIFDGWGNVLGG